ncbi:restriction endonuclease subunit S [Streptomyces sp. NPDC057499]|uniref:restriction endonuclease subunit S n=1 Tax=Streptomyces sp. NPDC057499 TaxID=3346150 RepID=UPI00369EC1B2
MLNPFTYDQTALVPIGSAYTVTLGKMLDAGKVANDSHTVLPYIRAANIQDDGLRLTDVNEMPFSDEEAARLDLRRDDLLVVEGGAVGTSVVLDRDMPGWSFQKTVNRVRATGDYSTRFLGYVLRAYRDARIIDLLCNGSTIRHLTAEKLRALRIPSMRPSEQRAIAGYLDRETARIDWLIKEQQRLIGMLRARRVATVAGALDGYDQTQVRRLVDHDRPMTYGILQCGDPVAGGVPYIGPSDILGEGESPDMGALRTTAPEIASAYKRSVLKGGDVVVSIGPAYGKVAVVSNDLAGANLTQDTVRVALRPDLAHTRFFMWALLSRQTAEYWDYQVMGATFRRLNLGTLARTPIPLPGIHEQRRIAAYLDEETAKIDTLIAESERFIELSEERRSALVAAAVTGQIDVGDVK